MKFGLFSTLVMVFIAGIVPVHSEIDLISPLSRGELQFLIVTEKKALSYCRDEIQEYSNLLQEEGLNTGILVVSGEPPHTIRKYLSNSYMQNRKMEGIVLVGDIPIPMLRDAQHLTSAFKVDQRKYSFFDSSVPSDRFYEDFDLKFDYLSPDSLQPLLFYYSLRYDSPQYVEKEIYSGRILPPLGSPNRMGVLKTFLKKVIDAHREKTPIDRLLVFTGHGYHSESLSSWEAEALSLREQFPVLSEPGGRIINLYHAMNPDLKIYLKQELENEELDMAIFHAHGGEERQLLLGLPVTKTIDQHIKEIRRILRSRLRDAETKNKDINELMKKYMDKYDVPEKWFENALDDNLRRTDSLFEASMDFLIDDIRQMEPSARVLYFDECFNGAFINDHYITGEYLFGKGNTIAAIANSVNVRQDIWADELLGMLTMGARLGEWQKYFPLLEMHILGDPTFFFLPEKDFLLSKKKVKTFFKKREIKKLLYSDAPAERVLGVKEYSITSRKSPEKLLVQLYNNDPSFDVRFEALVCLAKSNNREFRKILMKSINDPYELIRRITTIWMGRIGDEAYIKPLTIAMLSDESKRVRFQAKQSLELISPQKALDMLNTLSDSFYIPAYLPNSFKTSYNRLHKDLIPAIHDSSLTSAKRISKLRTFRAYPFSEVIDDLIMIAKNPDNSDEVRIQALESLGWYSLYIRKDKIEEFCRNLLSEGTQPPAVLNEAEKTVRRLKHGPNYLITP